MRDPQPLRWVGEYSGQPVERCFQCHKCSGGCPVAGTMDILPHQIIRCLHLGLEEELLGSRAIWLCTSCRTCKARCPNGIDIAAVNDALRARVLARGLRPALPAVADFHRQFLASVEKNGRVHELGMMVAYKLKIRNYLQDVPLGIKMLARGKFRLLPERIRGQKEIRTLFTKARGEQR
ncbi:MAG: 4Fe-4S dicluster domain-containing protein [Thermoanaerobacteraceae bacterium]|nr:4Fe-4S dicluster domain-containing protein [Thermoanaerobacteraceae bacterium]